MSNCVPSGNLFIVYLSKMPLHPWNSRHVPPGAPLPPRGREHCYFVWCDDDCQEEEATITQERDSRRKQGCSARTHKLENPAFAPKKSIDWRTESNDEAEPRRYEAVDLVSEVYECAGDCFQDGHYNSTIAVTAG